MPRLPFLDWMKAIGMFLIVFGHVVGGDVNLLTPPIYHKQWGVTFFLFATAFTLARETRPAWRVVVNRLFEIVLVGGLFAVASTIASLAAGGRGHLSNYWPFLFGANVLNDHFPANPTTWYIGTYIHVIVLWAVWARRLRPAAWWIGASAVVEIGVRALLWERAGGFVAYQALPNWITVLILGTWVGQRQDGDAPPRWTTAVAAAAAVIPLAIGTIWAFDDAFPFRGLTGAGAWSPIAASACVTLLYVGVTWLAYRVTSRWARSRVVEFLAAQTVFIFVAHMPLYYAMLPVMEDWPRWVRALPLVLANYVGLALVGAWLYRWLRPSDLRERIVAAVR